jgi:hypothetical protein
MGFLNRKIAGFSLILFRIAPDKNSMIDFNNISPQQISLLAVLVSSLGLWLSSVLFKLFDDKWNRNSRELSQIIDIDTKLNGSDKQVRELVELHQAKFHIEKERLREYKKRQYFMKSRGFKSIPTIIGFSLIRLLVIAFFASVFVGFYLIFSSSNLINSVFFWLMVLITFILTVRAGMPLQRILSHSTTDLTSYSVCLEKKGSTDRKFDIRIPKTSAISVYDYIGIPVGDNIEMYRKVTDSDHRVLYIYDYTRPMTLLELEWVNQLNQINKWFRRTSPYIPFLKTQRSEAITYSAYYLLEK